MNFAGRVYSLRGWRREAGERRVALGVYWLMMMVTRVAVGVADGRLRPMDWPAAPSLRPTLL